MFRSIKKIFLYLSLFLILTPLQGVGFDCRLMNQYGGGVAGAIVRITEAGKSTVLDEIITNRWGEFYSTIKTAVYTETKLYPAYPNPSKGSSILPILLKENSDIKLEIFNVRGEKVASKFITDLEAGFHQLPWIAIDNSGNKLPLGLYIIRMTSSDKISSIKIALLDHSSSIAIPGDPGIIIDEIFTGNKFDFYIHFSNGKFYQEKNITLHETVLNTIYTTEVLDMPFIAEGKHIKIFRDEEYVPIFLKGINLGAATPGTSPGALAATREQYASWIAEMAQNDLNYIRTYTLHFPRFYEELEKYNLAHPEKPLFLIQGVWLDEEYEGDLISGQSIKFDDDIAEVIDCMHGNKSITHRFGRAYGDFTTDVSPWVMSYIIGREIHPWEVEIIENKYPDLVSFDGDHFSIQDTCQLDIWMTERLDHAVAYMQDNYKIDKPMSCSSWPTLDPIYHPTENLPEKDTDEDKETFDMANIVNINAPAGFYMSYHAYPYYPDFISEDPGYQTYSDEMGPNSYLGYLVDLNNHYDNIPLVIAEFGVPSSWGNAHYSHSGMYHGGMTETEQGLFGVRMLRNIYDVGCAGGLLFAWIDEWFKNAWITAPFGSHPERRQFWQNVTSPEQNFGLKDYREKAPDFTRWPAVESSGDLLSVKADMDNAFFYVKLQTDSPLQNGDTIWVGFDTYRADLGESILPNGTTVANRAEFALAVTNGPHSPMFVTQAYDLYGIWHRRDNFSDPEQVYQSIPTDGAPWMPIRWKNNAGEEAYQEIGLLATVGEGDTPTSNDGVRINGNDILLRIPWSLLQFTDPSLKLVMHDDRSNNDDDPTQIDDREVMESDGVLLTVVYKNDILITGRCLWDNWNMPSNILEYNKESYQIFIDGAATISNTPK
ncbi:MAG: T9SS type A sorting domain-containing protein [Candidatus Neomarinimicrobiota bacterium]